MAKLGDFKLMETRRVEYALGIFATMRPMPNPDFDAYLATLQRPQRAGFRAGSVDSSDSNDMLYQAVAHTVLVNVEGADDCPEYTPEWGLAKFRDPEYYDFWSFVRTECSDLAKFRKDDDEATAKN